MKLRFPIAKVSYWARRYSYPRSDESLNDLRYAVKAQGHFTKNQLLEVCQWKSPRTLPGVQCNEKSYVVTVTKVALATEDERLRIESLTLLTGVGWPMASVMLHFGVGSDYPILDYRALWSLCCFAAPHQYDYELWRQYVRVCRQLAKRARVTVRTLDMALWQYSRENQD
jgi:hypothetical protein